MERSTKRSTLLQALLLYSQWGVSWADDEKAALAQLFNDDASNNSGAIIGSIFGVLIAVGLVIAIIFWSKRQKGSHPLGGMFTLKPGEEVEDNEEQEEEQQSSPDPPEVRVQQQNKSKDTVTESIELPMGEVLEVASLAPRSPEIMLRFKDQAQSVAADRRVQAVPGRTYRGGPGAAISSEKDGERNAVGVPTESDKWNNLKRGHAAAVTPGNEYELDKKSQAQTTTTAVPDESRTEYGTTKDTAPVSITETATSLSISALTASQETGVEVTMSSHPDSIGTGDEPLSTDEYNESNVSVKRSSRKNDSSLVKNQSTEDPSALKLSAVSLDKSADSISTDMGSGIAKGDKSSAETFVEGHSFAVTDPSAAKIAHVEGLSLHVDDYLSVAPTAEDEKMANQQSLHVTDDKGQVAAAETSQFVGARQVEKHEKPRSAAFVASNNRGAAHRDIREPADAPTTKKVRDDKTSGTIRTRSPRAKTSDDKKSPFGVHRAIGLPIGFQPQFKDQVQSVAAERIHTNRVEAAAYDGSSGLSRAVDEPTGIDQNSNLQAQNVTNESEAERHATEVATVNAREESIKPDASELDPAVIAAINVLCSDQTQGINPERLQRILATAAAHYEAEERTTSRGTNPKAGPDPGKKTGQDPDGQYGQAINDWRRDETIDSRRSADSVDDGYVTVPKARTHYDEVASAPVTAKPGRPIGQVVSISPTSNFVPSQSPIVTARQGAHSVRPTLEIPDLGRNDQPSGPLDRGKSTTSTATIVVPKDLSRVVSQPGLRTARAMFEAPRNNAEQKDPVLVSKRRQKEPGSDSGKKKPPPSNATQTKKTSTTMSSSDSVPQRRTRSKNSKTRTAVKKPHKHTSSKRRKVPSETTDDSSSRCEC